MFIDRIQEFVEQRLRENASNARAVNSPPDQPTSNTAASDGAASPSAPPTLLLVDHEPALLELLSHRLKDHGYRVLTAESGEVALELCSNENRIDILVCEVRMPTDGFKVAAAVKSAHPHAVVVLMSFTPIDFAKLDPSSHFLAKPFAHEVLLAAIAQTAGPRPSLEQHAVTRTHDSKTS